MTLESYAGRPANTNPNIHHNIISQPNSIVRPMIEVRYANELGGLSALTGNPTMSDNCYYIAGKNAIFTDRRPSSTIENAGLSAWQSHINGERGSLEVDPALNADYMPTNPQCTEMGATLSFSTLPTSTLASSNGSSSSGGGSSSSKPSASNLTPNASTNSGLTSDENSNGSSLIDATESSPWTLSRIAFVMGVVLIVVGIVSVLLQKKPKTL